MWLIVFVELEMEDNVLFFAIMFYVRSYVFVRQMFHHSNSIVRGLISPCGIGPLCVHDSINDITNRHVWGHSFLCLQCEVSLGHD